ncbi:hypothetical protein Tco_1008861 [Tanacetum coccineum]
MQNLKENVHAIKGRYESGDEMHYLSSEEVKFVKATEYREDSLRVTLGNNSPSRNISKLKEILGKYLEESCKRQGMFDEWMERFRDNTDKKLRRHDSAIKGIEENVARLAQAVKTHNRLNQNKTLDMKRGPIISLPFDNSNLAHQDNKVPIILGRAMLATAYARIDVLSRKISLEVGTEKVVFNANEEKAPLPVYVINDFQVLEELEETEDLEEFLMNDDINEDLGDFLEENDLLLKIDLDTLEVIPESGDEIGIKLEDLGEWIEIF